MKPKDHNGAFPDWAALTPKYAAGELPRRLAAAEAEVAALEASEPKGFEDLVWRLDDAMRAEEPERQGAFAIVMFDCNRLKQINDQHGHSAVRSSLDSKGDRS